MSRSLRAVAALLVAVACLPGLPGCGGGDSAPVVSPPPPAPPTPPSPPSGSPQIGLLAGTFGGAGHADGAAHLSRFNQPAGIAVDRQGNRYVADRYNHVVRRIAPNGQVATLAGAPGQAGSDDGAAAVARFRLPSGLVLDEAARVLYVADTGNHTVRKLSLVDGGVSTVAGKANFPGSDPGGNGQPAKLDQPVGLALRGSALLIVERGNHAVRQLVAPQQLAVLAGRVDEAGDAELSAAPQDARFRAPSAIAVQPDTGDVFVVDQGNCVLRRVGGTSVDLVAGANGDCRSANGGFGLGRLDFTALLAGGAAFSPDGRLFLSDRSGVREVDSSGALFTPVVAAAARVPAPPAGWHPEMAGGMAIDADGSLLVLDTQGHSVYALQFTAGGGTASVLAGQPPHGGVPLVPGELGTVWALGAGSSDSLLVGGKKGVQRITRGEGLSEVLAPAPSNKVLGVSSMAETGDGLLFAVVELQVPVDLDGPYATLNGYRDGVLKFSIESMRPLEDDLGQPEIGLPFAMALDKSGRAVIADGGAGVIRRVDTDGKVTLVAGRPGVWGSELGDALNEARFFEPTSVAVLRNGDILVLDYAFDNSSRVLRISRVNGRDVVSLVADQLEYSPSMAVDEADNIYLVHPARCVIERLRPNGERSVFAGQPGVCAFEPGALPGRLATNNPFGSTALTVRDKHLVLTMDGGVVEIGPLPD